MIVRRLACHAAPSDTAVFYEELRVALATARTVLSLAQQVSVSLTSAWKAAAWSPAAREDCRRRQRDIQALPVNRSRLHDCIENT